MFLRLNNIRWRKLHYEKFSTFYYFKSNSIIQDKTNKLCITTRFEWNHVLFLDIQFDETIQSLVVCNILLKCEQQPLGSRWSHDSTASHLRQWTAWQCSRQIKNKLRSRMADNSVIGVYPWLNVWGNIISYWSPIIARIFIHNTYLIHIQKGCVRNGTNLFI